MTLDIARYPYLQLIGMKREPMLKRFTEIREGRTTHADMSYLAKAEAKRRRRALVGAAVGLLGMSVGGG